MRWTEGLNPQHAQRDDQETGPFGLRPVMDLTSWPCSACGRVDVTFSNERRRSCSGTLISPWHALTAAHVVHDRGLGGWAREIRFVPAGVGGNTALESAKAARILTFQGWCGELDWSEGCVRDWEYDLALLVLDAPIGGVAGYHGLATCLEPAAMVGCSVRVAGYPKDLEELDRFDGSRLFESAGQITWVLEEQLRHTAETRHGMSGAGVLARLPGLMEPKVVGVHSGDLDGPDVGAKSAARITPWKLERLLEWMRTTW